MYQWLWQIISKFVITVSRRMSPDIPYPNHTDVSPCDCSPALIKIGDCRKNGFRFFVSTNIVHFWWDFVNLKNASLKKYCLMTHTQL